MKAHITTKGSDYPESGVVHIFAQKFLQHSRLYWLDGNVQIYSNLCETSAGFEPPPHHPNPPPGPINIPDYIDGMAVCKGNQRRSYTAILCNFLLRSNLYGGDIQLLYISTLPSHQYNLECCKNFCMKICCFPALGSWMEDYVLIENYHIISSTICGGSVHLVKFSIMWYMLARWPQWCIVLRSTS